MHVSGQSSADFEVGPLREAFAKHASEYEGNSTAEQAHGTAKPENYIGGR